MPPFRNTFTNQNRAEILVPPLNFAMILPGQSSPKSRPLHTTLTPLARCVSFRPPQRKELSIHGHAQPPKHHVSLLTSLSPDPRLTRADTPQNRYLSNDDYRHDTYSWAQTRGLKIFHHRIESCKEPFVEVDEDRVVEALEQIIGQSPRLISVNSR
jgi:hypothetical protein